MLWTSRSKTAYNQAGRVKFVSGSCKDLLYFGEGVIYLTLFL